MAVAQGGVIIAPSSDIRTLTQLNNTRIEAGLYQCNESRTISAGHIAITSDQWSVLCISSVAQATIHCYMQIWVPSGSTVSTGVTPFIRYSTSGNTWSDFRAILTDRSAVQTNSNSDVRVVISNTQPTAITGTDIIWLDTSS